MLADVDAGSDTPSLVGKVLKWRQESSEMGQRLLSGAVLKDSSCTAHLASALWNALDTVNQALSKTLLRMSELHARDPAAYAKAVKYLSTLQSVQVSGQ